MAQSAAHLTVRLPAELAAEFRQVCAQEERPVSQELRRLIRQRIAENGSARPSGPSASSRGEEDPAHESG